MGILLVFRHASGLFVMFNQVVKWLLRSYDMLLFFWSAGIVADSNAYDQSKRLRTGGDYNHTGYSAPSPFHPPPAPVWGPHG